MKNTLWTFGCSFTAEWNPVGESYRTLYDDYKDWKGGQLPPVWPTILAKNIKMNLENKGEGATGNDDIFMKFCNNSGSIKSGDVVIVGWTQILRYLLSSHDETHLMNILPNMEYPEFSRNITEFITVNRSYKPWYLQIISYITIIKNYCNAIGAKSFFWTSDGEMYSYFKENYKDIDDTLFIDYQYNDIFQYMRDKFKNAPFFTIIEETNGEVKDQHLCEAGHKYQADLILKHILKNGVSI